MATTATGKKFRKVRLHKAAKELNLTVDTIVGHLSERGYTDALKGNGLNAAIVDEEAYLDLVDHYSEDREIRARVQELRAIRESELSDREPQPDVVAEEDEPPSDTAPDQEAVAEVADEPASLPEAEAVSEPDAEVSPEGIDSADEEEVVSEPEISEDVEAELSAEPVDEDEPSAEPVAADVEETPHLDAEHPEEAERVLSQEEETPEQDEPADEAADISPVGSEELAEFGEGESEEGVISADRYKLQGTKVLGRIDLKAVEGADEPGPKRRGKRKRKKVTASAKSVQEAAEKSAATTTPSKRKRKRKPKVDSEEVGQSVQETLRSMDQGNVRVRQRRRRARRQQRAEERMNIQIEQEEKAREIRVTEFVSTGELADLMGVQVTEIISMLLSSGMMVSINQRLDADTIAYVADEFGCTVEFITEFGADDIEVIEDDPEDLKPRAPVVTVMGHVDHGKTSLLDYVRNASVAAGESGGITQHIGAYKVALDGDRVVTFLDTPGHEAFTAMRARGAKVTDVVILVVAANDSVMPQTIEAINHAKAAGVALIIAINKIDLEQADVQRVMKELADYNVLVEQYGGNVQCAYVSAKTGEGIDDLLEKVLLEADLLELKGNPKRHAQGIVIESRLDRGRGNIATVLVQNGTLKIGDPFVAGVYGGRVRAMFDEWDNRIKSVGPSEPALVLGLPGQPTVGDQLAGVENESEAREIAQRRQQIWREQKMRQYKHVRLEDIGRRMALGDFSELNLIIKADVGGSVEAISDSLHKISTDEVAVSIIHAGVGAITESDVMLASASDAVIIGFQVRPTAGARAAAEREEIDIRTYSIIYDAIEDVRDALEGLLTPEETEKITGVAEVREVFKVPKIGSVAGCYISEGRIRRSDTVHVLRESIVIYKGRLASLRRFKEDVREVVSGYECGIGVENYNDIKIGDQIEAFEMVQTKRTLDVS
ncbi:MAG: translation initiation factor IF-2 [Rhodothermaceae bacterium]|nr:translation initiation factor IF-2 [Rhodothermaceae bacterium]MXZ57036.1 translation initiation factor IF-2 [Rhodothermaceae bacterium]MYB90770.1 translation initiation factor IF-2 [Rhodothermaceae bacterium]MYD68673.1 translation initiation factor IF-2 [Rhodothermaceae bacterium]MYG45262.1 translation initiation factor IF-2 [Rhodothermaceae bacterium]